MVMSSASDPAASFAPVSITTVWILVKVIDSKATPSLVPEMRFWLSPGLSITITSALPGVIKVSVVGRAVVSRPVGLVPSTGGVAAPSMNTGSRPVKEIEVAPACIKPSPKTWPGV